jgi:hypothetical protein
MIFDSRFLTSDLERMRAAILFQSQIKMFLLPLTIHDWKNNSSGFGGLEADYVIKIETMEG